MFVQVYEPCNIKYNAVIKLESVVEDSDWLFKKVNLTNHLADWREITGNAGKSAHVGPGGSGGQSSGDVTLTYMQQIPKHKIEALYNKYKLDFLMFDYSIDDYL